MNDNGGYAHNSVQQLKSVRSVTTNPNETFNVPPSPHSQPPPLTPKVVFILVFTVLLRQADNFTAHSMLTLYIIKNMTMIWSNLLRTQKRAKYLQRNKLYALYSLILFARSMIKEQIKTDGLLNKTIIQAICNSSSSSRSNTQCIQNISLLKITKCHCHRRSMLFCYWQHAYLFGLSKKINKKYPYLYLHQFYRCFRNNSKKSSKLLCMLLSP